MLPQYILQAKGQILFTCRSGAEEIHWLTGSPSRSASVQVGWSCSHKHQRVTNQISLIFPGISQLCTASCIITFPFSPWLQTPQIPTHTWTLRIPNSEHSGTEPVLCAAPLTGDVLCMRMVLLEPAVQTLIRSSAQRSKAHRPQFFSLLPHSKKQASPAALLEGWIRVPAAGEDAELHRELGKAGSSGGAVSNQVLFTSHIVLKPDVISILSASTCHRQRREIDLFAKNQIYPEGASSEPARNCPLQKCPQHLGTPRDESVNQCHSRFLFPRRLRQRRCGIPGLGGWNGMGWVGMG